MKSNDERLAVAVRAAVEALRPFVTGRLSNAFEKGWQETSLAVLRTKRRAKDPFGDFRTLLSLMIARNRDRNLWDEIFAQGFDDPYDASRARGHIYEALEIGNAIAHNRKFSDQETDRALDTFRWVLRDLGVKGAPEIDAELRALKAIGSGADQDAARPTSAELLRDRLRRMAPGSTRYTLAEIVQGDDIYVAVPWRRWAAADASEGMDLADVLAASLGGNRVDGRHLIVAAPGSGKTTLSLRLADRLARSDSTVVHVDLAVHKQERGSAEFGTQPWAQTVYGISPIDAGPQILLLDSLDELLSGFEQSQITDLLSRYLFQRADAVFCRLSYFERYLSASSFAERFTERYELTGLSPDLQEALAHRYLKAMFPGDADTLSRIVSGWLDGDPVRRSICAFPLHLMLAVEAVSPERDDLAGIDDLVGLWQKHVERVLARESQRPGAILDADRRAEHLEAVAWHFYDEEGAGNADPPLFTRSELRDFLRTRMQDADVGPIADELENHTLLAAGTSMPVPEPSAMLHFTHRSLHTYFVARHLYESLVRAERDVFAAFSKFLSGEVSRMLLEFLARAKPQQRLAGHAATQLVRVLETDSPSPGIARARWRIARQQAAYYLGALGGPAALRHLRTALEAEDDLWVSRGMAIGLSLAGDDSALMHQINLRRAEREKGALSPYCDVNLGYHLSFAGDQPLDVLQPDVDQGEPSCSLTVATLVRQLELPAKRGSWRSTLFTFVDLARHRPASRPSFAEAVRRHRDRLEPILKAIAEDPSTSSWPEIAEAQQVVNDVTE